MSGNTVNTHFEIRQSASRACANVLGVAVDAVNQRSALSLIHRMLLHGPRGYVCAVGVHGVLEALRNPAVAQALAHAALALPDGTPTVWVGRAQGVREMDHVTGPAVMQAVFTRPEFARFSHFLYGGKPGVAGQLAAQLRAQAPGARIVGTFTPPFRELNESEESELVVMIERLRPDMIWVGISTPRQELWMQRMLPRLETRCMFGVGAAFDFLSGHVRICPVWMKKAGLNWLHRLAQDPRRLWRRNLGNTAFLWHIALQLSGVRRYPLTRTGLAANEIRETLDVAGEAS